VKILQQLYRDVLSSVSGSAIESPEKPSTICHCCKAGRANRDSNRLPFELEPFPMSGLFNKIEA
jgi:hypothetical protein